MRFFNYVTENRPEETPWSAADPEHLLKLLKHDCKQFLDATRGFVFFRGDTASFRFYGTKKPRSDRRPLDSPKLLHDTLDKVLFKQFGWKPRSEGVFATKSHGIASDFALKGTTYLFFPIGDFKFVYNTKWSDLFAWWRDAPKHGTTEHEVIEQMKDDGVYDTFTDKNLNKVTHQSEVSFKCKEYYLVNPDWFTNDYRRRLFI